MWQVLGLEWLGLAGGTRAIGREVAARLAGLTGEGVEQQLNGSAFVRHLGTVPGTVAPDTRRWPTGSGRCSPTVVSRSVRGSRASGSSAGALGIGRGTVAAAYEQLRETGHLARRRGSGTWTALPSRPVHHRPVVPFAPSSGAGLPGIAPGVVDLAHAAPAAPADAMAAAGQEALAALPDHLVGPGYDLLGLPVLRTAIAERLTAQGLPTAPDEVMVTCGSQHAHSLVVRALVRPGDRMLHRAADLPERDRPRPPRLRAPGPDGPRPRRGRPPRWDVAAFAAILRESAPALGLSGARSPQPHRRGHGRRDAGRGGRGGPPSRGPTGRSTTACGDLWLGEPVPPPVGAWASVPGEAPVLTLGSLSKSVWGGVRIGWLRAPRDGAAAASPPVRASDDIASPVLEQLVATALLGRLDDVLAADGAWSWPSVVTTCWGRSPGRCRTGRAPSRTGGFSLWVDLGVPRSSALVEAAARHGVHLAAGPRFGTGGAFERYVRFPYTHPVDVLDDAVARLAPPGRHWAPARRRCSRPSSDLVICFAARGRLHSPKRGGWTPWRSHGHSGSMTTVREAGAAAGLENDKALLDDINRAILRALADDPRASMRRPRAPGRDVRARGDRARAAPRARRGDPRVPARHRPGGGRLPDRGVGAGASRARPGQGRGAARGPAARGRRGHRITGEDCLLMRIQVRDVADLDRVLELWIERGSTVTSVIKTSLVEPRPVGIDRLRATARRRGRRPGTPGRRRGRAGRGRSS